MWANTEKQLREPGRPEPHKNHKSPVTNHQCQTSILQAGLKRRPVRECSMSISVLDLSAYLGLTAVGAVTLNMILGTLMAFRYSPVRYWPHRKFNYFRLHKFSGYVALVTGAAHPLL